MGFKKLIATAAIAASLVMPGVVVAQDQPVVGLVMKSLSNEFFKNMLEGAEAHNAKLGTYELRAVGMQSETDIETQINAVENFITQGVDAIVIAPADSRALVPPLKRAVDSGIVVVNIDVELDAKAKQDAGLELAFVGPDNRAGAKMSGDALAEALGEGGKVVILEGNPGADNAVQRKLGFDDAVADGNLDLLDSRTAHWETEEANTVFTNMLTVNPDIQGVMAANDSMALGVVTALAASGRTDIQVVGFDNVPAIQPMIKNGQVLATVDQFGSQMAAIGIEKALEVVDGGAPLEGWVKTDLELVTADTLD